MRIYTLQTLLWDIFIRYEPDYKLFSSYLFAFAREIAFILIAPLHLFPLMKLARERAPLQFPSPGPSRPHREKRCRCTHTWERLRGRESGERAGWEPLSFLLQRVSPPPRWWGVPRLAEGRGSLVVAARRSRAYFSPVANTVSARLSRARRDRGVLLWQNASPALFSQAARRRLSPFIAVYRRPCRGSRSQESSHTECGRNLDLATTARFRERQGAGPAVDVCEKKKGKNRRTRPRADGDLIRVGAESKNPRVLREPGRFQEDRQPAMTRFSAARRFASDGRPDGGSREWTVVNARRSDVNVRRACFSVLVARLLSS